MAKKDKTTSDRYPVPLFSWNQVAELTNVSEIRNDEIKEFVPHFYTDNPRWYALRVRGDSMIASSGHSKSFHDEDIIIVDPDKTVQHSNYVIAMLPKSREAIFKQYVIDGGMRYLKPLNPQYPMMEINDNTHICGVIAMSIKNLI